MRRLVRIALGVATCLPLLGQQSEKISGIVEGATNLISGARVAISPLVRSGGGDAASDAPATEVFTNPGGYFELTIDKPGRYKVEASADNYCPETEFHDFPETKSLKLQLKTGLIAECTSAIKVEASLPSPEAPTDKPGLSENLGSAQILNIARSSAQDFRLALNDLPRVIADSTGNLHINGGNVNQTEYRLNGFRINDPGSNYLNIHLNVDAVQQMAIAVTDTDMTRGRGTAGAVDIDTITMSYRPDLLGSDFFPDLTTEDGLKVKRWTPRMMFTTPLGNCLSPLGWFENATDVFYKLNIVDGLPANENTGTVWEFNSLSHLILKAGSRQRIFTSFLFNRSAAGNQGLTIVTPREATTDNLQHRYFGSIKDEIQVSNRTSLSLGIADVVSNARVTPHGNAPLELLPEGALGNYNVASAQKVSRPQLIVQITRSGERNVIQAGFDFQRPSTRLTVSRNELKVLREDGSLAEQIDYFGGSYRRRANLLGAGYVQETWHPAANLRLDAGVRGEWDEIGRSLLWSPRVGFSVFGNKRRTKLAGSWAVTYNEPDLNILSLNEEQTSRIIFFGEKDVVDRGPILGRYAVSDRQFKTERSTSFSTYVEREMLAGMWAKIGYTTRRDINTPLTTPAQDPPYVIYQIQTNGTAHYKAWEVTVRQARTNYYWLASYLRSDATTSGVIGYGIDSPVLGAQVPGPQGWDAPNRLLLNGFYLTSQNGFWPLRKLTFSGRMEYHTGFPFSEVTEVQQIFGRANGFRLPAYASLDLSVERKVRFLGRDWTARIMVANVTDRLNPVNVVNNIDAGNFLAYSRGQKRSFTFRLRLLNILRDRYDCR